MSQDNMKSADSLSWCECITVHCGISLTKVYVAERLAVLSHTEAEETLRFRKTYGGEHWRSVLDWFQQAERELSGAMK